MEKKDTITNESKQDVEEAAGKTIVIDPGHGGNDGGSIGQGGTLEKDITLKTAKNIRQKLIDHTTATVILTRENDEYVSLEERVDISEEQSADLFISIHYDAFTSPDVEGMTTYYHHKTDKIVANTIHEHLFNKTMQTKDRGVSFGDYQVLRENTRPAILLELGYISNAQEEKRMNSPKFQEQIATAIADGIIEYLAPN